MKSKNRMSNIVGVLAALLLTAGIAQAGDDKANNVIDQNLSKRPYHQAPVESKANSDAAANKADNWDGATLVTDDAGEAKADAAKAGPNNYQKLRIRMLGQRPYMEKSAE